MFRVHSKPKPKRKPVSEWLPYKFQTRPTPRDEKQTRRQVPKDEETVFADQFLLLMTDRQLDDPGTNQNRRGKDFGSEELRALVGGGGFLHQTQSAITKGGHKANNNKRKGEWGDYTVAETAALLRSEQERKQQQEPSHKLHQQRHRADGSKQRNYKQLVSLPDEDDSDDAPNPQQTKAQMEPASFPLASKNGAPRRKRMQPVVLQVGKATQQQPGDDNSSNSSSHADDVPRKRYDSSSSSDDDDSVVDRRRQRLLQRSKVQAKASDPTTLLEPSEVLATRDPAAKPLQPKSPETDSRTEYKSSQPLKRRRPIDDESSSGGSSSSSGSDEESGSSSGSSSSSSGSHDDASAPPERPKLVFVPKHLRKLQQKIPDDGSEEEERRQKQLQERRIRESRALVQQALTARKAEVNTDPTTEVDGIRCTPGDLPSDTIEDEARAKLEWEVRELERLLQDWDLEQERVAEAKEVERRRKRTDMECMQEDGDKTTRLERQPQRFYHKGAFYMDESEWDQNDVRHKAELYASAATGDDKRDKRILPKIMQVKKFGFANQSKWKGLKAEDTTDKDAEMLSLAHQKNKSGTK